MAGFTEDFDTPAAARVRADARSWFEANWDPELTLGDWWRLVADSGWGFATWPKEWFGIDLDPQLMRVVAQEVGRVGAVKPPHGIATMMAGPAILAHGTPEQKARFLPPIVYGEDLWCQLFSEPGAGSDLAGLTTKAVRDGDEWIIDGQKVWTSSAQHARYGFLLARTDPDVPKHKGLTYFLIDMDQPGIEVRPLREMSGSDTFSEVFLTGARVPHDQVLGEVGAGWKVAMTTLSHERQGMGAGSTDEVGGGEVYGIPPLAARAGDIAGSRHEHPGRRMVYGAGAMDLLRQILADTGSADDPIARQQVARIHSLIEVARYTRLRNQAAKALGKNPGPAASVGKLASSRLARELRDTVLALLGPTGALDGDDAYDLVVRDLVLFSPSVSIAGGTDEVQHNIVGERVLGLPREPSVDRDVPFRDLPRN